MNELKNLQEWVLDRKPALGAARPQELLTSLRNRLLRAFDEGWLLAPKPNEIAGVLKLDRASTKDETWRFEGGGRKDLKRLPTSARIVRNDKAWIHFTMEVRQHKRPDRLEMLAYNFEIVFAEAHCPPFLRFDLNPSGHSNEARELRSHLHPGHDELQVPAPWMTPLEILDVFLDGLRPRDPDKVRATAYICIPLGAVEEQPRGLTYADGPHDQEATAEP